MAGMLRAKGYHVLTFDMRGVGASTGWKTYLGNKEVQDVIAAANWGTEHLNMDCVVVASSAGAPIAGSAINSISRCVGYVAIGYVFGRWASLLFG